MSLEEGFGAAWRALLRDPRIGELAAACGSTPVHLVGGAVRDAALGLPVEDLDAVVESSASVIATRLALRLGGRAIALGGERFGAQRVVFAAGEIDLWDRCGGPLEADLWRRDLTVNAIAVTLSSGEVVDPTGGTADLARRRLRATRLSVFAEDPVRVLRLARLALSLPGFSVEAATIQAARASTFALDAMPAERLRVELESLLDRHELAPASAWLSRLDLLEWLFPRGHEAPLRPRRSPPQVARLDRSRRARALRERTSADRERNRELPLHWAALALLAVREPWKAGETLDGIARRGLVTRAEQEVARALLLPGWRPPRGAERSRLWLHEAGETWPEALALRAAFAEPASARASWKRLAREFDAWGEKRRSAVISPPRLVSGEEVQALLHLGPGPAVGRALARLRRAQVRGDVRSRDEALALLLAESAESGGR